MYISSLCVKVDLMRAVISGTNCFAFIFSGCISWLSMLFQMPADKKLPTPSETRLGKINFYILTTKFCTPLGFFSHRSNFFNEPK